MLCITFRTAVTFASILGIFHMIANDDYNYIIFPISIIIWAIYSVFDENDKEYLRRNGLTQDDVSWFPWGGDYEYVGGNNYHHQTTTHSTYSNGYYQHQYTPNNDALVYKELKKKCKRNFVITVEKNEQFTIKPNGNRKG